MARPNRKAEITRLLALRESQGLTYAELSRRTGISVSTFSWWSRRLREEADEEKELFAQVSVVEERPTSTTGSGVSIRVQDIEGTNVLLLGPPGVGKTALAVGLAIKALEAGHRILFVACHDLVIRFRRASRLGREDRLLTTMLRPRLLILDEIGYTPLERPEATFLFEVIAKRYERQKSMIVTSNKSWGAWGEILPDQVMTAAILDRLLHRSVTFNIQGESYRLREHRRAGLTPSGIEGGKEVASS